MQELKFYKNKELSQEIEENTFNLGIVPAGEKRQFKFWVLNNSNHFYRKLEFIYEHPEVKILSAPEELIAHTSKEFVIEWSPNITLEEGLKAILRIKYEKIVG